MVIYANRGKTLEEMIEKSNERYSKYGIAEIRKVPTPFRVLRTYEKNHGLKVGHTLPGEWVDYVGVHRGRFVAFEAKQTKGKSLPLSNINENQIDFMEKVEENGGKAFLIVYFSDLEEYYKIPFSLLDSYIDNAYKGGRKSIPVKDLRGHYMIINNPIDGILEYL